MLWLMVALALGGGAWKAEDPVAHRTRCASGEELLNLQVGGDGKARACWSAIKPKGSPGKVKLEHQRGNAVIASASAPSWSTEADAGAADGCHTFADVKKGDKVALLCAEEIKHSFAISLTLESAP